MLAAALSVASLSLATSLWLSRSPLRGAAWPLVLVGLLELGVGIGLLVRTNPQVRTLEAGFRDAPQGTAAAELQRMERVNRSFRVIMRIELVLILAGALLAFLLRTKNLTWAAVGAGVCCRRQRCSSSISLPSSAPTSTPAGYRGSPARAREPDPSRSGGLMSELRYPASDAQEQAAAYIAAILKALGSRDPLDVLREMPSALRQAVAGLSAAELALPEAPGKWSIRQVFQHLSDSDLVGGFRFRMVLAHDRPALAGYDQDAWVERVHGNDEDAEAALAEFTAQRQGNVRLFERLKPEDLERVALHAERGPESLGYMMRLYAGHDVVHLRQVKRIREAVAPAAP